MSGPRSTKTLCAVALGANLGDARATLRWARGELSELADDDFRSSSLWESQPWECPPGSPTFLNAVVVFRHHARDPAELLAMLHGIEAEAGRAQGKGVTNAPRELDLDLLFFGEAFLTTSALTLPHPRALERAFVMAPLAELAATMVWPGSKQTVASLLSGLSSESRADCTRIEGAW
jgi:2-amino-4-hydroxy-6-hydroxymethyldihydropteridine diphosphokinase